MSVLPPQTVYSLKAGIELGFFEETWASGKGKIAGCPFCNARKFPSELRGKRMQLNGPRAGQIDGEVDDSYLWNQDTDLIAEVSNLYAPHWLPDISIRHNFIVDEIIVWFCNNSLRGEDFYWDRKSLGTLVGIIWDKMLPVTANEISSVAIAHGMPSHFQNEFENLFSFGIDTLRMNCKKSARKSWRQINAVQDAFAEAHRFNR
ncbi:hypothetical protein [Sphingobium yanoikuyae]|uniref:hypothetical protein n=1 Tax=Sphingobium yanoikuyae TaxID=13690 RepID=UPI001BE478A6|nr:hypothetical protein [Sphingobium yanoikuyae]